MACYIVATEQKENLWTDLNANDEILMQDKFRNILEKSQQKNINTRHLRLEEFSWDEEGFSLMSELYADIAQMCDDKFRYKQGLFLEKT